MKQYRLFPFLLILVIVSSSCHVTRNLKDGEYDEFRILICAVPVRRGFQVEFLRGKILLNLLVDDGRFAGIDHVDLFLDEINGLDRIVLGKQHGHR